MLSRLYRYGQSPNSHDLLKTLATVLMIIDHLGAYVFVQHTWMRILGRGAAPCFFFLIGYFPPKLPTKPLLIYGTLLTILFYYTNHTFFLNILLNFAFIKLFLLFLDDQSFEELQWQWLIMLLVFFNPLLYPFIEYGTSGLLIALSAHLLIKNAPNSKGFLTFAVFHLLFYEFFGLNPLSPADMLLFTLVACSVFFILLFYHLREWHTPPGTGILFLLISRYSLAIYFWHLAVLRLIHYAYK